MTIRNIVLVLYSLAFLDCKDSPTFTLLITNANVLDVEAGNVLENRSVIIDKGLIKGISSEFENIQAHQVINAEGRLVTPGFIDTHIHPTDVFGDREKAPEKLPKNARQQLSEAYLPFGTTTTLILGQPEPWLETILEWQKDPSPQWTDHYTAGGALISKAKGAPYIGHSVLENPAHAKAKIRAYHNLGIRHIKLYYRLHTPELEMAYRTADSLEMNIYGHIGGFGLRYPKIPETLELGLVNYEHLGIIPNNVLTTQKDWDALDAQFAANFGAMDSEARVLECLLEQFRYLHTYKRKDMESFIDELALHRVSFSTTLHYLYQQFKATYFTAPSDKNLTPAQKKTLHGEFWNFNGIHKKNAR